MSLQAEKQAAAAYDDDNWQIEARETAARINNDIQQIVAQAEEVLLRWAEDGLLDRSHRVAQFDHSVGYHVMVDLPRRSALQASGHWASALSDVLYDALSLSAREAVEQSRA